MNRRIAAKITAQNRANILANALVLQFHNVLNAFVGCKVLNKNGFTAAKLDDRLNELIGIVRGLYPDIQIYRRMSEYSFCFSVKTSEPDSDCSVCYADATMYVGTIEKGILSMLTHPETLPTDYTYEDYEANSMELTKAQERVNDLRRRYNWMMR